LKAHSRVKKIQKRYRKARRKKKSSKKKSDARVRPGPNRKKRKKDEIQQGVRTKKARHKK